MGGNRKRESERVIRNFGRADVRAARAKRKRKERAMRVVNAAPPLLGTRNIQRKLGHVPRERETKKRNTEKRATEEGERKLWRADSTVITSAGLNGGISRYLWHNFTGFTMAYIRGPVERISPPPGDPHMSHWDIRNPLSSSRSLISSIIPPYWSPFSPNTSPCSCDPPYVFVHLVSNGNDVLEVFLIRS